MKQTKTFIFILIFALALASVVSCGSKSSDVPKGMKLAESDFVDFYLYVPETWTVDVSAGYVSAYVPDDKSNVSVTAMTGTRKYSNVNDYISQYLAELEQTYAGYEYVENESIISTEEKPDTGLTLGGIEASRIVFKMKINGQTYKFMQLISSHSYIYTLTYTALEENFDSHIDDVNKIISNFKFTK